MESVAGGISFPVIFFDGEREIDIGHVLVHPSHSFKNFLSILSQRIGIYPHQISVYLVDRTRSRPGRIPITSKVSFADSVENRDSFFYAVLKRSRTDRRRMGQKIFTGYEIPAADLTLWRRNWGIDGDRPFPAHLPLVEYENRVWMLEMERRRYLSSMGYSDLGFAGDDTRTHPDGGSDHGGGVSGGFFVCDECLRAEKVGREAEFHLCVHDAVMVGFRSPAGPIARPGYNC